MRWFRRADLAVAAAVIAFGSAALSAQVDSANGALRGRIIDARTTQAIPRVVVVLTLAGDTIGRAETDSGGTFTVRARKAPQVFAHFIRVGYRADSVQTEIGGASPLRIAMTPTTTVVAALKSATHESSALTDFDRRATNRAGGVFLTEKDIERRRPTHTSDLFRSLLGVAVRDSFGIIQLISTRGMHLSTPPRSTVQASAGPGTPATSASAGVGPASGSPPPGVDARRCMIRVVLDGQLTDATFSVDDVPPSAIRGIEVYLGAATIPAEFSSVRQDALCGIVLIWTRSGE